jgi:hypothetical protein
MGLTDLLLRGFRIDCCRSQEVQCESYGSFGEPYCLDYLFVSLSVFVE